MHVTTGEATDRFREAFYAQALKDSSEGLPPQSDLDLPAAYTGVYKERQREVGWQLYGAVGVAYGDRAGSGKQMLENYRLFGAPHALVITTERNLGTYGVLDCGSYLGTLVLVAQSMGVGLVPQAAFATCCPLIRKFFHIPDHRAIVCGASFGLPDLEHPANSFRSRRAPVSDAVSWMDT